jgi:Na+/glutamate symporter
MNKKDDKKTRNEDVKQASTIIAVGSIIGLTVCFVFALSQKADIPLFLYAIFGGGILGTDNILKIIKSIFRIDR